MLVHERSQCLYCNYLHLHEVASPEIYKAQPESFGLSVLEIKPKHVKFVLRFFI
jgi:hypothetical protein